MALHFNEQVSGKSITVVQHARITVKAKPGEKYFLIDEATGKTPKDIEAHRLGDQLLLKSVANDIEILIEDFWSACRPGESQCFVLLDTPEALGGELVGQTIITQEGRALEALLAGEIGTLGESAVAAIPTWAAIGGGIFGLAAVGAALGGGGGGGGSSPDSTAPAAPTIAVSDRDGDNKIDADGTAEPGSKVTVTWPDGTVSTTTAGSDGKWRIESPTVQGSGEVKATATDAAGNVSDEAKADYTDSTAPAAPTIAVSDRDGDNKIDADGTAEPGSKVTVTWPDGTVSTTTAGSDGKWRIESPTVQGSGEVKATATDAAGNVSGEAKADYTDTTAPAAPTIAVSDRDGDNKIDADGTAEPGSKVTVTWPDGTVSTTTAGSDGKWRIESPTVQGSGEVKATATDAAGNVSGEAKADYTDTTAPAAPILTANTDGSVSVSPPADADVTSYTVQYTDENGTAHSVTVSQQPDGSWSSSDAALTPDAEGAVTLPDNSVKDGSTVTAVAKDAANNESIPATAIGADVAPDAPKLTANADGSVIAAPADGDTARLLVKYLDPQGKEQTIELDKQTDGTWRSAATPPADVSIDPASGSVTIPEALLKDGTAVTGVAYDSGGQSASDHITPVNIAPAAPVVTLGGVGDDGMINASESPNVTARVTLPANAKPGDTLNVDYTGDGTADYTHVLTAADIAAGAYALPIPVAVIPRNGTLTVDATLTDTLGATGEKDSISADTDLVAPAVTVTPQGDAVKTLAEATDAGGIITINGEAGSTSTVTLTGSKGSVTQTVSNDGTAKPVVLTAEEAKTLGDGVVEVSVVTRDAAGNITTTPDGNDGDFTLDTTIPAALMITFPQDTNNDGKLTSSASGSGEVDAHATGIAVKVAFDPHTVQRGDTLMIKDNAGNERHVVLTDADVRNGSVTQTFPKPAEDGTLSVTANIRDAAGNVFSNTAGASVEVNLLPPGTPTVTIDADTNNDGHINMTEMPANGKTEVTVTLPPPPGAGDAYAAAKVGDTVTLFAADGTTILGTHVLDAENIAAGAYTFTDIALPGDGESFTVKAQLKDNHGVTDPGWTSGAPGHDHVIVNTTPPTVTLSSVPGGSLKIGDTATITFTLSEASHDFTLDDVTVSGGTLSGFQKISDTAYTAIFTPTANTDNGNANITVAAGKFADVAGNPNTAATPVTISYDTLAPTVTAALAAESDSGVKGDNITHHTTPKLSGKTEAGATVKVEINDKAYTATAGSDGTFTVTVSDALPAGIYLPKLTVTDTTGNVATATGTSFTVDTGIAAPMVQLADASDSGIKGDGITNDDTPTLTGKTEAGAAVNVEINGKTITTTADDNGNWRVTVPAGDALPDNTYNVAVRVTDVAGNTATTTIPLTIDSSKPATATLTNGSADGVLSAADAAVDQGIKGTAADAAGGTATLVDAAGKAIIGKDGHPITASIAADGSFTIPNAQLPADGRYFVDVADAAGNHSDTDVPIRVDTTAPAAPSVTVTDDVPGGIVGSIAPNGITNDATPTFSGKVDAAEAGSTVTVNVGGQTLTTKAGADGAWSVTPTTPLGDGAHTASVTLTDSAGNVSHAVGVPFVVDTTAPATPTLNVVAGDDTINAAEAAAGVSLGGTAEAGSTVTVRDAANKVIGTVNADSHGNWTMPLTAAQITALGEGADSFTVTATDAAGNRSTSAPHPVNVDTTAPAAPSVTVTDDVEGATGAVAPNGITNDATPTFSGKVGAAEAGGTVTVNVGGQTLTAVVQADGTWSVTPVTPLGDGAHTASVTLTDKAGNTGAATTIPFSVDATAPATPTLNVVAGDDTINAAEAAAGVSLGGTAEAGSTVTVRDAANKVIGTVNADSHGNWTMPLTAAQITALGEGADSFTVTATDAAGNRSTSAPHPVNVDTTAPAAPTVSFTQNADNNGFLDAAELPTATEAIRVNVALGAGSAAGDTLTVQSNNGEKQNFTLTAADIANGFITTQFNQPAEDETLTVTASQTDLAGNASPEGKRSVVIDRLSPSAPKVEIVADADNNGYINAAERPPNGKTAVKISWDSAGTPKVGDTVKLYQEGNATPLATHQLTQEDINNGFYTFADAVDLMENQRLDVKANITDSNHIAGAFGADNAWVDSTKPATPGLTATDNVEGITGAIAADGVTNDATPTFSGKADAAEAGGTVTVNVGGQTLTTTVGADGTWSVTPITPLGDGAHTASVTLSDKAGNVSDPATLNFNVDTAVPAAPPVSVTDDVPGGIVGSIAPNGITNDATPTFSGKVGAAEAGGTVTVNVGGQNLTAVVQADGTWSVTPTAKLGDGAHTASATLTDKAGNTGAATEISFTVDTVPPADVGKLHDITGVTNNGEKPNQINAAEAKAGTILSGYDAEPGSTVTVTHIGGGLSGATNPMLIGTAMVNSDGTWSMPLSSAQIATMQEGWHRLSVTTTDVAGNTSVEPLIRDFIKDTVPPKTTLLIDPITGDDLLSVTEMGGNVTVTGKVTGTALKDYNQGDIVTLTIGGKTYNAAIQANGTFSTSVPGSALKDDTDRVVDGSVTVHDEAGNAAVATATHRYAVAADVDVVASSANLSENGQAAQTAFTVNVNPATGVTQLAYAVTGGTATAGADFTNATFSNGVTYDAEQGVLIIPANVSSFKIGYTVVQDKTTEGVETITANIGGTPYTVGIGDTSLSEASISVAGPLTVDGKAAAAENDSSPTGVLTYTVSLTKPAGVDVTVNVTLDGTATVAGQAGADYTVGGLSNGSSVSGNTVTLVIKAGQTSASFTVDPIFEPDLNTFGGEPNESVIATIVGGSNYTVGSDTATGIILNNNPQAMKQLTGDMSLQVGPLVTDFENMNFNTAQKPPAENGITTTDYDDVVYVGFLQDGTAQGYGNISAVGAFINDGGLVTDNNRALTTVDMGKGNDRLQIDGYQDSNTRVYLGEGDDTYILGNGIGYPVSLNSYVFAESGNDTITSSGSIVNASVYLGSGSDAFKLTGGLDNSILDLGSGKAMPDAYLKTYADGVTSLGNDDNTDLATDTNTVEIKGNVAGDSTIEGGAGIDKVTVDGAVKGTVNLGAGNDVLMAQGGLSGTVDLGDGNDTVTVTANGIGMIQGGAGTDTLVYAAADNQFNATTNSLDAAHFKGIEKVVFDGAKQAVAEIAYSDLLADTTNTGPLYISKQGSGSYGVDLKNDHNVFGSGNNWNGDFASPDGNAKLGDWSKVGTETVGGVTYDRYHHASAGSDGSNDVLIQTGIIVL